MKITTILITLFCLHSISSKGQEYKNNIQEDTIISKSKYYIPTVNSSFETFDFKTTIEETLKDPGKAAALKNSEAKEKGYSYEGKLDENKSIHRSFFEIMGKNKKFIIKPGEYHPLEVIFYNDSPFAIRKTFYPNGNIKEKGLYIVSGNFHKGVWYHFDESGKLIHTIDNDKIFGFSWEQVEKFMEENKIPMPLGNTYVHGKTTIYRGSPLLYPQSSVINPIFKSEKKLWSITWKGEKWNQYFEVVLDGDTGKMLYRRKYWAAEEPGDKVPAPIIEDFTTISRTTEGKDFEQVKKCIEN